MRLMPCRALLSFRCCGGGRNAANPAPRRLVNYARSSSWTQQQGERHFQSPAACRAVPDPPAGELRASM